MSEHQLTCEHTFVFLRQERKEIGYRAVIKEDVFFCEKCVTYKRVKVYDSRDDTRY